MMYSADGAPLGTWAPDFTGYDPQSGSVLYQRITQENYQTPAPRNRIAVTPETPMEGPIAVVTYSGEGLTYDDLHPIYATGPENAPIAATAPGQWGQVVAAGRR